MKTAFLILACCAVSSCAPAKQSIEIPFSVRFGDIEISCESPPSGPVLTDLRLFVHSVRLLGAAGEEIDVTLTSDDRWQTDGVALLDFENGQGACENGSPAMHTTLKGQYSGTPVLGLRMEIGVPETLNHADPLAATGPLTLSSMHWHWKSGYKFMRAGFVVPEADGFWMHLGSSRCEGTIGNMLGCRGANRPVIDLPGYIPGESIVVIDLAQLAAQTDLSDGIISECQSGPAESACAEPFDSLGIDFASGANHSPAAVFVSE